MSSFRSWASFLLISIFLNICIAITAPDNEQQHILASTHSPVSRSWNFNFSSSAPHYFASVQGLAQQWPNTFFPNGHSIVPCEIPPYTKFYHGRTDAELPESPEWLAFDIEMAYGIMGSTRNSHILTYQTNRPVKAIYFDGESATLMGAGRMDTQMLQIYLNTSGAPWDGSDGNRRFGLWPEYDRANKLCAWIKDKGLGGRGWGFEGIVRMNAGFEMIWCDFESLSATLVSHLNVTAPLLPATTTEAAVKYETSYFPLPPLPTKSPAPADPMPPPNWRRDTAREPFLRSQGWGWFTSATNHYGFSGLGPGYGETRIRPLTCGLMNYYSPEFHSQAFARAETERKSLNLTEDGLWIGPGKTGNRTVALKMLMRRRRSHQLADVSVADASAMRDASESAFAGLVNGTARCSGFDWTVLTNEIVQRHASDLFNFLQLLLDLKSTSESGNKTELQLALVELRGKSHSFLLPYLEYPGSRDEPKRDDIWKISSDLSRSTYSRCRYHHTRLLTEELGVHLNPQEKTLKWAVEETFGGICAALIGVGFGIEEAWEKNFGIAIADKDETSNIILAEELKWWTKGIEELMSWLGWAGNWVRCEKRCKWDEQCFIPMWPMIARHPLPPGGPPGHRPEPPKDGRPLSEDQVSQGEEEPSPLRERPPYYGYGRRPGRGGGPGWMFDDSDLWEPKCVKAEYIMG